MVRDRSGQCRGAIVVPGDGELAQPGGPVVVEVALDPELVGQGSAGDHDGAPASATAVWGQRMTHSATARLMTQPAALARSPGSSPVPNRAASMPPVNAVGADGVGADHPGAVGGDV